MLSHQDREQLSNRQAAAIYDIRNPNQVVVLRRALDDGGVTELQRGRPARSVETDTPNPEPPDTDGASSHRALREEVERLRAEVDAAARAAEVGDGKGYSMVEQCANVAPETFQISIFGATHGMFGFPKATAYQ